MGGALLPYGLAGGGDSITVAERAVLRRFRPGRIGGE